MLQYLATYLSVGAPVYFVVKDNGLNYTDIDLQRKVCGGQGFDTDSMVTQIFLASKVKNRSYISASPSSWIDDYFDWLRSGECCKINPEDGSFCHASSGGKERYATPFNKEQFNLFN